MQFFAMESKGIMEWKFILILWGLLIILSLISIGYIVVGKSIREEKKWALGVVGFILAILALPSFPVGTAIGIYAIWSLSMNLKGKSSELNNSN
jgi:hypothetical protein